VASTHGRIFWWFAGNGARTNRADLAGNITRTVPEAAMREGNFARLLTVNPVLNQVYDPLSVRADSARKNHYIRSPFPGNVIPAARMVNPVLDTYLPFIPLPNDQSPDPRAGFANNYLAAGMPNTAESRSYSNRVDYLPNARHHIFARWLYSNLVEDRGDWTYETAPGLSSNGASRRSRGANLDWTFAVSPALVISAGASLGELRKGTRITPAQSLTPSQSRTPGVPGRVCGSTGYPAPDDHPRRLQSRPGGLSADRPLSHSGVPCGRDTTVAGTLDPGRL
jgi:hypothetical protein